MGVFIIRILPFRVLYLLGSIIFGNSQMATVKGVLRALGLNSVQRITG